MAKNYKKFLNKAEAVKDNPVSPIKVGESSSGNSGEVKENEKLPVDRFVNQRVASQMITMKSAQPANIERGSFVTNQQTDDENKNKRISKSMDDEVQKEYEIHGVPVCIEWPAGQPRRYGKDLDKIGKTSTADYGYFKHTKSIDGGGIDVYIGPSKESKNVYLLLQKPTPWDVEHGMVEPEQKYMLGFGSIEEAEQTYKASMPEEWFMSIGEVAFPDFLEVIRKAYLEKAVDSEYEWMLMNQGQIEKWSMQKSNGASADWRTGFKQTQDELKKYLEGEQSAIANQQTSHTAELSSEAPAQPSVNENRMELAKKLMGIGKTPRPTSEGIMSRESERKANRTPLVRHTRLVDAGQTSAIPLFPNRLHTIKKSKSDFLKSMLSTPLLQHDEDDDIQIVFEI